MNFYKLLFLDAFILSLAYLLLFIPGNEDCLGVPPGGLSGFWYSMAKLKKNNELSVYNLDPSVELRPSQNYYCASSGCLAVISSYIDGHKVYNFAVKSRDEGKTLSEIKNKFINLTTRELNFLPNLNIVTMTRYGTCLAQSAQNKIHLKKLLIETTDIPFLMPTGERLDGGLCYHYMNECERNIKLPLDYRFIKNLFNYNLKNEDVLYFYNYI